MTNPTLFVACKFRPEDSRSYTYEWTGEPLAPGDMVKVPDKSGDGWKAVTVASVTDEAPPFACKPILGRYNPDEVPEPAGELRDVFDALNVEVPLEDRHPF
ncbi:hypothetical protein FHS95_000125 [Sphingomonas naasensis]|uniref:Uncharacterized protein n=1 Tax=Sphingomonas naasensis TaxID=1344951 RepID=A0A4S1WQV1_9SPHN|nr:hypothetical protein [Sphingomonas naasensis]NIJ18456.1 hypothetical protein [Sphingomonas naasensis]TGX45719.1 hypothetical protein E5A74_00615 [Sphingomonas naasensis]